MRQSSCTPKDTKGGKRMQTITVHKVKTVGFCIFYNSKVTREIPSNY